MARFLPLLVVFALSIVPVSAEAPPRETRLEEKPFDALSNRNLTPRGVKAFGDQPQKWKHAETDHFILHYRRATEAQKVAREVEYDLAFVAQALHATPDRYARKSHVYVFQDDREWANFRFESGIPEWSGSVAFGDELFLHVGGPGEGFDSAKLAHETAHAVVARIYPGGRWPRWLNEGLAEYMGTASVAARKRLRLQGLQHNLGDAAFSPDQLMAMTDYPTEQEKVNQFYQSSEKLIRFLMTEFPQDRFPAFVDAILGGAKFPDALLKVYGDCVADYPAFLKRYNRPGR